MTECTDDRGLTRNKGSADRVQMEYVRVLKGVQMDAQQRDASRGAA